jgi:hypothetical protein
MTFNSFKKIWSFSVGIHFKFKNSIIFEKNKNNDKEPKSNYGKSTSFK